MTVFRLALSELKRMTGGVLPKLAIVAMAMVPLLYGAVYLYANWDPYGNLNQLKAAIVVDDRGATVNGKSMNVGEQVAKNLVDGKKFDWVQVDSDQAADDGVANGKYSFALKIPAEFSANLASPADFDAAQKAILNVTTNDANNYLLSTIVDKVTSQVHASVALQVGETTANQLLTGYGTIHSQIAKATEGANQLADGAKQLNDGVGTLKSGSGQLADGTAQLNSAQQQLADGANKLSSGANQLSSGLNQLDQKTAGLPDSTKKLADGAAQVAAGNQQLNAKVQNVAGTLSQWDQTAKNELENVMTKLELSDQQKADIRGAISKDVQPLKDKISTDSQNIQKLADASQAVSDGANQLAAATPALSSAINSANQGAAQLAGGAGQLADGENQAVTGTQKLADGAKTLDDGVAKLADGSAKVNDGAGQLASGLATGLEKIPNPGDATKDKASKVIADPIGVNNVSQAKASSYGAGLAPFFLVLALWIGAFMLVQAMRPLTKRALASNAPSWKIAVGGWLPFFTVSLVQTLALYSVVNFALGLNPAHPWGTLGLLLLASMAFTALIQGIVALLGTPGKFVVLILLVLQLVSSGGTFPWQTTPEPLHTLHAILPMGHVVEGMRSLIYGANVTQLLPICLGLIGYTALGLLLSFLAVRKNKTWTLKTLQPEIAI